MELLPAPVGDKPRVAVRGAGPVSDVVGSLQHRGQLPGVYLRPQWRKTGDKHCGSGTRNRTR